MAAASGATVRVCGISDPDHPIEGVMFTASPAEAADGSNVLLLSLPGEQGLAVFAPHNDGAIIIDEKILQLLAPGAEIFCGHVSTEFADVAARLKVPVHEYEADTAGRLQGTCHC